MRNGMMMKYKYKARRALLLNREITWDGEISNDIDSVASVTTRGSELVSIFFFDEDAENSFVADATELFPGFDTEQAVATLVNQVRNGKAA
jgi:hypothetical protein